MRELSLYFNRDDGEIRHLYFSASPWVYYRRLFGSVLKIKGIMGMVQLHERDDDRRDDSAFEQESF